MIFYSTHKDPDSSHPRRSENLRTLSRLKGVMNTEMQMNENLTNMSFSQREKGKSAYTGLRKEPDPPLITFMKWVVLFWETVSGTRSLKQYL